MNMGSETDFQSLSEAVFKNGHTLKRSASPYMPHIVRAQWEPDDHVAELCHMLQGMY